MQSVQCEVGVIQVCTCRCHVLVHACACECVRLICVEWYTGSAQYAGHHHLYDSMIVGPLVAQSNVLVFSTASFSLLCFLYFSAFSAISLLFLLPLLSRSSISRSSFLQLPRRARLCLSPFLSNEGRQSNPSD